MRRRKQAIHLLLLGILAFVGEERVDFCNRGRQADQVQA